MHTTALMEFYLIDVHAHICVRVLVLEICGLGSLMVKNAKVAGLNP